MQCAADLGISTTRARQLLVDACRTLGMPNDIAAIRRNAQAYLARLAVPATSDPADLGKKAINELTDKLGLTEVTPTALARLSAGQLASRGVGPGRIADVQEWLRQHGRRLRQDDLLTAEQLRRLEQAALLLDAYHVDVRAALEQLKAEREARARLD